MTSRSILVFGAFTTALFMASLARAQDVVPAPQPSPVDAGAPAPAVDAPMLGTAPPAITVTDDQLNKLIDARIAKRAADAAAAAAATPAPTQPTPNKPADPFAFADFSWAPGNYGSSDRPLSFGPFTGELRMDTVYHYEFSHPSDNTISGSSEVFRHNEVQMTQIGFGGDFLYKNVQARLMTQFGMYSQTTPRNDSSPAIGQWNLADAYRYISEAYGGYHLNVLNGINIQAGIFMSYVGLWSYYNFDNWTYQPSYVSSNTPWFFNGARVQIFPSDKVKIEPWLVNGWQSYGKFNQAPGVGMQILWKPTGYLTVLGNQYFGTDALGVPDRKRLHTDDSIMVKYYENKGGAFSKAAASLTADAGCEIGGDGAAQVSCDSQFFLGFMAYTRFWFAADELGLTLGGGAITNPGRYLVLLPPVNGATAASGTPYFTENPGDKYEAWDMQITGDYMPSQFLTFRLEYNHRAASTPYFAGSNGMTPPGGNQGGPGSMVEGWNPDLVNTEDRLTAAMMVKF
jgi:Putative beta-barrel porin-2, OmpL-like. bbp2